MSLNKRLMSSQPAPFVASENFKVVTYTGNSGTQAITGVGFKPDLVWFKSRTSGNSQNWTDSTRGAGKLIFTNNNDAEYDASAKFTSFDADGFTLSGSDNYLNNSSQEYVAWCFKAGGGTTSTNSNGSINSTVQANSDAGFSIIKYDGGNISGSTTTVGHGLSAAPELIIVKTYESGLSASEWFVYSQNVGNTKEGYFNQNGAFGLDTDRWNSTSPTSSVFTLGSSWSDYPGYYGGDTIAYAFHSVTGFSKIGSYTGTGTTGNAQVCGFEPAFLLSKRTSSTSDWYIIDNKRNTTNPRDNFINANTTDAEYTPSYGVNFNSNGFSFISTDLNGNGQEWIYMAFAADPDTEAPTLASSFNIETWTGNDNNNRPITGLGFNPNLVWIKRRNSSESHALYDSLTGANNQLSTDTDAAIAVNSGDYLGLSSFDSDGFTLGNNGGTNRDPNTYVGWTWKADDNEPTINEEGNSDSIVSANSNAGFSIVKYTGNQTAGHTIGHGLSAKPDMIILKCLDTVRPWYVYHKGVDASNPAHYNLRLNETDARQDSTTEFNDTEPTSTVFTLGTASGPNGTNSAYIAYCFHDVAGYQKFGSYAGSGSAVTVTTGFKPDFVMIKSTSVEWWNILDSKRDFNKRIYPSENNAESGASDYMTVTATSFTITVTGNDSLNNSGKNFIYWAIAKNVPSNTTLADSFGVVKYTGIGASKKVQGLSFKPDLVWMKQRSGTQDQMWYDNNRGAGNYISSNNANAQGYANSTVTSFDSDGFSVGSSNSENQNSQTFVAWCWKAGNTWQSNIEGSIPSITNTNTANGFSVVKWTGTGSNGTVGHGLSSTPELIISKNLDTAATDGWPVYSSAIGNDHTLFLNSSSAKSSTGGTWGSTSPTSSVFTVQDNAANNQSSNEIIAYCFHSVSGYSKISSYSGTGSSNAITGLGFRPDTIILKEIDGGDSWQLYDTVRGPGKVVYPNGNNAEYAGSELTSFDSDGFTVSGNSSNNESGKTYLYAAWKMNTTLNTTLENSFRNMPYTGTGAELAVTGAGFKPDLVWITSRDGTTWNNAFAKAGAWYGGG